MSPIKLKLDVTKLDKALFFRSEKTGAIYCDLVAWPLRDPGDRQETHLLKQSSPKDDRERQMPIVGNLTLPREEAQPRPSSSPVASPAEDDEIPF